MSPCEGIVFPPNEAKTLPQAYSHQSSGTGLCCFSYFKYVFVYFQAKITWLCLVKGTDQEVSLKAGTLRSTTSKCFCSKRDFVYNTGNLKAWSESLTGTRAQGQPLNTCTSSKYKFLSNFIFELIFIIHHIFDICSCCYLSLWFFVWMQN